MTYEEVPGEAPKVPPASGPWARVRHWLQVIEAPVVWSALAIGVSTLGWAGLNMIETPYSLERPGPVVDVQAVVEPAPRLRHGALYLTTVMLTPAHAREWVISYFDPKSLMVPRDELQPRTLTPSQYARMTTQMMDESKTVAKVVALRAAGYPVAISGQGAQVQDLLEGSLASGHLMSGDIVVKVGDTPIQTATDLVAATSAYQPGDSMPVTVRRGAGTEEVKVPLGAYPDNPKRARIGIAVLTHVFAFETPVTVTIKTDDIGGSSAGLMFSLGIYQGITETDLTGGHRVAGTGTLTIEGKVGGVSGVRMKVFGAEAAGAELFLVPTENLAEAQAASTKLRVEAVATFDDALRVVRAFAAG